jgi:hypothetical protein
MESITIRDKFKEVVDIHRQKAAHSEYDHKVCVDSPCQMGQPYLEGL